MTKTLPTASDGALRAEAAFLLARLDRKTIAGIALAKMMERNSYGEPHVAWHTSGAIADAVLALTPTPGETPGQDAVEALKKVKAWIDCDLPAGTPRAGTIHMLVSNALASLRSTQADTGGESQTPAPAGDAVEALKLADDFERSGATLFRPEQYPPGYEQGWKEAHAYCAKDLRALAHQTSAPAASEGHGR